MAAEVEQVSAVDVGRLACLEAALDPKLSNPLRTFLGTDMSRPADHGFHGVAEVLKKNVLMRERRDGMTSVPSFLGGSSGKVELVVDVQRRIKYAWEVICSNHVSKGTWHACQFIVGILETTVSLEVQEKSALQGDLFWVGFLFQEDCVNAVDVLHIAGFTTTSKMLSAYIHRTPPDMNSHSDLENRLSLVGRMHENRRARYPLDIHTSQDIVDWFQLGKLDELVKKRGLDVILITKLKLPTLNPIELVNILYQVRWLKEANKMFESYDAALDNHTENTWRPSFEHRHDHQA